MKYCNHLTDKIINTITKRAVVLRFGNKGILKFKSLIRGSEHMSGANNECNHVRNFTHTADSTTHTPQTPILNIFL